MVSEKSVDYIEGIEFCRSRPVAVGSSYTMVRGISSLSRDCTTLLNIPDERHLKEMLSAVGFCGMVINNAIPVHSALHGRMFTLGGLNVTDRLLTMHNDFNMIERMGYSLKHSQPITDQTRLSYFRAFGISPHVQSLLEGYYSNAQVGALTIRVKELPLLHSDLHINAFKFNF